MVARGFSNADNISPMGRNLFCHTLSGPSLQYQRTVLQNLDAITLPQLLSSSLQFQQSTQCIESAALVNYILKCSPMDVWGDAIYFVTHYRRSLSY